MIQALIKIKHRFPSLWDGVEVINGALFRFRCRGLSAAAESVLGTRSAAGCRFSRVEEADLEPLAAFFRRQGPEDMVWFHPHAFDLKSLRKRFRNPAFLMMKASAPDGETVGYFFLRCFFIGRAFAGLYVVRPWRSQGIGTAMWASCAEISQRAGLRMQATISADNQASIRSCRKGTEAHLVKELDDPYLAVECQQKRS